MLNSVPWAVPDDKISLRLQFYTIKKNNYTLIKMHVTNTWLEIGEKLVQGTESSVSANYGDESIHFVNCDATLKLAGNLERQTCNSARALDNWPCHKEPLHIMPKP